MLLSVKTGLCKDYWIFKTSNPCLGVARQDPPGWPEPDLLIPSLGQVYEVMVKFGSICLTRLIIGLSMGFCLFTRFYLFCHSKFSHIFRLLRAEFWLHIGMWFSLSFIYKVVLSMYSYSCVFVYASCISPLLW